MKKFLMIILLTPLLSCGNTDKEVPENALTLESTAPTATFDHAAWTALLKKHVSAKGNVDYKGFQKDEKALDAYLTYLGTNIPTKSDSKNTVLAYWINVYNAFTVKLILNHYPVKSIKDIKDPWGTKFFTLNGKKYSLEEVEHEILRKMDEPRIHFAINCASFSCPNLANEAYTAEQLDKQLTKATKSFMADETKNTLTTNRIEVSQIFNWFSSDFKKKGSIIDFINQYAPIKIDAKAKVKYKNYDWKLND